MATFVLVPGAGGMAWYWHRVVPLLRAAKHDAVAVDLPGDDKNAGLPAYTEIVERAIGERRDVILVAQSLGGFTAPLVCQRVPIGMLLFVNAMIPLPRETAGAWWEATGAVEARKSAAKRGGYSGEFDVETYFLHDVPPEAMRDAPQPRQEADIVFANPCKFDRWPDIPIRVLAGRHDRFFPLDFQNRIARERLSKDVDAISGGHLLALANPEGLVKRLAAYAEELQN